MSVFTYEIAQAVSEELCDLGLLAKADFKSARQRGGSATISVARFEFVSMPPLAAVIYEGGDMSIYGHRKEFDGFSGLAPLMNGAVNVSQYIDRDINIFRYQEAVIDHFASEIVRRYLRHVNEVDNKTKLRTISDAESLGLCDMQIAAIAEAIADGRLKAI